MEKNLKESSILVVDDQVANIDMLRDFLELEGYVHISSTTDSRQVMEILGSLKPDLILLDLMMPHLSGYDVLQLIRSGLPKDDYLPILVLTADITSEAKQKALTLGASDFLIKPFDLTEVGLRIANLLLTRSLMHQLRDQNRILDEKVKLRTEELERANLELTDARDKAVASDRLKTAFMQNISHEVRTPLNGILGFSRLMADPEIDADQKNQFMSFLEISSNRLLATITDYMDISLLACGSMVVERKTVPLNEMLRELEGKFSKRCAAKNLNLDFAIQESHNDFTLNSDPELLGKIFSHLLDNAVKFTREGSISLNYLIKGSDIEIRVRDSGKGISEEERERIFEPFMQEEIDTSRGYEGSGLGLSIVKGILSLLDGEIRLESEKGTGSEFIILLPVDARTKRKDPEVAEMVAEKIKSPVLLVAEDDDANRLFLELILRKRVSTVLQARDGREAVEMCRKHPEITLVLMDIKMPVMNGVEATREIKSFRKELPIIAVTAYAMTGDERQIREAGCDDFLAKPVMATALDSKLKKFGLSKA